MEILYNNLSFVSFNLIMLPFYILFFSQSCQKPIIFYKKYWWCGDGVTVTKNHMRQKAKSFNGFTWVIEKHGSNYREQSGR